MSEKDFDDRIRKKLDSLQADYTPEAWENFRKLLPVPWYVTFLKTYGGWIFGGISSLALLFNLLFNSKPEPFEKTDTLTTIEEERIPEKEIRYVTDTVYQTHTVYKYIYRDRYLGSPVARTDEGRGSDTGVNDDADNESAVLQTVPLTDLPVYAQEENTAREPKKQERKTEKDTLLIGAETKPSVAPKRRFWPNFNARPGVETDYMGGNNAFSFGPLVEIFLKNRFSVSTGVSIANSSAMSYPVPKDFNKDTGKNFEDSYKPPKPPGPGTGGIRDITIETSRIRMPLYMSYYVPLTYQLDFLISTGTKLDLKVSENVTYVNDGFKDNPYQNTESRYKPKVFNNLYYGMGVQYRYGRINGQIAPYFEFPFSKPTYLVSPNKFGVNAALKFSLK